MNATNDWIPQEVRDVDSVFGGNMKAILPLMSEIPDEFKRNENPWVKFQQQWFFKGVNTKQLTPKKGIDKTKALRHLSAIQSSFEPKHEHKQAAVAWLASLWFESAPQK